jgi:CTP-dependent riboflavin kinase
VILCFGGRVFSGKGEGEKFIRLPWVKRQIREKLGFSPYLGTMNIKLDEESVKLKQELTRASGIEISPVPGFCRGKLFKACLLNGTACAVVIPEVSGYPEDVLEIIASTCLRQRLDLLDGDGVEIQIRI